MTTYTIKEAGQRTGLSAHTIRHYTDMGLIPTLVRDEHNNRLFDEASIHWLYAIKFLRQSQMSLKEVRSFFTENAYDPTKIADRVKLLRTAIQVADAKLAAQIAAHDQLKAELEATLERIEC